MKEEILKKWIDTGLLDGLIGKTNDKLIKLLESSEKQIIKEDSALPRLNDR